MSADVLLSVDVETRFGRFPVSSADVVHFAHGVPGFEGCRRYVLITAPALAPFTCLHGLDAPAPSFLTIDPRQAVAGYDLPLGAAERARLDAPIGEPLLWLSVVHVDADAVTANLRAPIVINPRHMRGLQCMAHDTAWATDHRLTDE